jgi:hypothetical protein
MMGHRHLIAHLLTGGMIQQDDSGLAWVCASRSGRNFPNETVAHVREHGFSHFRERYRLADAGRGMLMAVEDTTPKPRREPSAKTRKAREKAPRKPTRRAREKTGRLT